MARERARQGLRAGERSLEPALDARRSLWAQRYDDAYDRVEIGFGEFWGNQQRRHMIFMMALGHGVTTQDDRTVKTLDLDFALYRYRRLGHAAFSIDAIVLTSEALKAGTDNKGGVAGAFMPVRLRYEGLPKFVQVRGGEYFFLPGLRALNYLCDGGGS